MLNKPVYLIYPVYSQLLPFPSLEDVQGNYHWESRKETYENFLQLDNTYPNKKNINLWIEYCYRAQISQMGFPSGSDGKESACNAGDLSLVSRLRKSPEEGMAIH